MQVSARRRDSRLFVFLTAREDSVDLLPTARYKTPEILKESYSSNPLEIEKYLATLLRTRRQTPGSIIQ